MLLLVLLVLILILLLLLLLLGTSLRTTLKLKRQLYFNFHVTSHRNKFSKSFTSAIIEVCIRLGEPVFACCTIRINVDMSLAFSFTAANLL